MKPGIYAVRGTIGPDKSELVNVRVGSLAADPSLRAHYEAAGKPHGLCAWFSFREYDCAYVPRHLSPLPERIKPVKLPLDIQSTARSIARAAFDAAKKAAEDETSEDQKRREDEEQSAMGIDDIALGAMARRSMGVPQ